jgi:glycerol-3-phosphate cytidylyltransferase-like family protein
MLQARKLGKELYVGIHSDQAILENKGPTVMTLPERLVEVSFQQKVKFQLIRLAHGFRLLVCVCVKQSGCR